MGPPLQDFLCAFELSDWVFPVAHSANCCMPPTSEAGWPLSQHPALLGREDCTLVAWYRSIYAPRTGGAYDSHHRTAGIAGCTRRRGGHVAARGGRAAARQAADHWFSRLD